MLRFLLWRLLGLLALLVGCAATGWLLSGGPGRLMRGASSHVAPIGAASLLRVVGQVPPAVWDWAPLAGVRLARLLIVLAIVQAGVLLASRCLARGGRSYVRMKVEPYRTDQASAEAVVRMHDVVQFLDGPGGRSKADDADDEAGGDGDRELVGVGAEELDVTF